MPLGLPAYDCDPNTGICGGGFGGGGPAGFAWGVSNVPYFGGYDPRLREPGDVSVQGPVVSVQEPQTQMPAPMTTQAERGQRSEVRSQTNWIVPMLIIIAAIAMSK